MGKPNPFCRPQSRPGESLPTTTTTTTVSPEDIFVIPVSGASCPKVDDTVTTTTVSPGDDVIINIPCPTTSTTTTTPPTNYVLISYFDSETCSSTNNLSACNRLSRAFIGSYKGIGFEYIGDGQYTGFKAFDIEIEASTNWGTSWFAIYSKRTEFISASYTTPYPQYLWYGNDSPSYNPKYYITRALADIPYIYSFTTQGADVPLYRVRAKAVAQNGGYDLTPWSEWKYLYQSNNTFANSFKISNLLATKTSPGPNVILSSTDNSWINLNDTLSFSAPVDYLIEYAVGAGSWIKMNNKLIGFTSCSDNTPHHILKSSVTLDFSQYPFQGTYSIKFRVTPFGADYIGSSTISNTLSYP